LWQSSSFIDINSRSSFAVTRDYLFTGETNRNSTVAH
jgi:hypothetical protein